MRKYIAKGQKINLTNLEIDAFACKINSIEDLLYNHPATSQKTCYANIASWKTSVAGCISEQSRTLLFRKLEEKLFIGRGKCKTCNIQLTIFNQQAWPGELCWKNACNAKCSNIKRSQTRAITSPNIGDKISAAKKKFFKTPYGKQIAQTVGAKNSIAMKKYCADPTTAVEREKRNLQQSKSMLAKIANGTFTPGVHNRWTNWTAIIGDRKFRSSWEACFWFCNQHLEFEALRVPYDGKTYIADFYDTDLKILYELKPKSVMIKEYVKISHVIEYCIANNISFVWINEDNLLSFLNEEKLLSCESALIQYKKAIKNVSRN